MSKQSLCQLSDSLLLLNDINQDCKKIETRHFE